MVLLATEKPSLTKLADLTADCLHTLDVDETSWDHISKLLTSLWKFGQFPHRYQSLMQWVTSHLDNSKISEQLWSLTSTLLTEENFRKEIEAKPEEKIITIRFVKKYIEKVQEAKERQQVARLLALGEALFQFEALAKEFKWKNFDICSQFTAAWVSLLCRLKDLKDEDAASSEHGYDDVMTFVTSLMRNNLQLLHKTGSAIKTFMLNMDILFLPTMQLMKCGDNLSTNLNEVLHEYYRDGVFNKSFDFLHESYAQHDPSAQPDAEKRDPAAATHHHRRIHEKLKMAATRYSAAALVTYFKCMTSSKLSRHYRFNYLVKLVDIVMSPACGDVTTVGSISEMILMMSVGEERVEAQMEFYANLVVNLVDAPAHVTPDTCRLVENLCSINFQRLVEPSLPTLFRKLNDYYVTTGDDVSSHVDALFFKMTSSFSQVKNIVPIFIASVQGSNSAIAIQLVESFASAMTSHLQLWPHNTMLDMWEIIQQHFLQPSAAAAATTEETSGPPVAKVARLANVATTNGAGEHDSAAADDKLLMLATLLTNLVEALPLLTMRQESVQVRVQKMMTSLTSVVTSLAPRNTVVWLKLMVTCDAVKSMLRHYDQTGRYDDMQMSWEGDDDVTTCDEMISIMTSSAAQLSRYALKWLMKYYQSQKQQDNPDTKALQEKITSAINKWVTMTPMNGDVVRGMLFVLDEQLKLPDIAMTSGDVMKMIDVTKTGKFQSSEQMQLVVLGKIWKEFSTICGLADVMGDGKLKKFDKLITEMAAGKQQHNNELYEQVATILADFISAQRKTKTTVDDKLKVPNLTRMADILQLRIPLTSLKPQAAMTSLLMTSLVMIATNKMMTSSLHERFVVVARHLLVSNTKTDGISKMLPFEQIMEMLMKNYEKYSCKGMVDDVIAVLIRTSLSSRRTHLLINKQLSSKKKRPQSTLVRHLVSNITAALVEGNPRFNDVIMTTQQSGSGHHVTIEWWKARSMTSSRVDSMMTSSSQQQQQRDVTSYCREQLQTIASSLEVATMTSSQRESSFVADFGLGVAAWKLDGEKSFEKLRQKIKTTTETKLTSSSSSVPFLRIYYDVIVFLTQLGHQVVLDSEEWKKMAEFLLVSGHDGCEDILVLLMILHPSVQALNELFSSALSCLNVKNGDVKASLKLVHLVALCYDKRKKNFRNLQQQEDEVDEEDDSEKQVSEGVKISLKFLRNSFDLISEISKSTNVSSDLICESLKLLSQLVSIGPKLITSGQISSAFHSLVNTAMTSSTDNGVFSGVYDVINGILVNHKGPSVNMSTSVISVIRRLLNYIMKNSRKEGIGELCEFLQRISHLIAAQYPTFYKKKCCYLLVDYIYGISTGEIHPTVKESLTSSMYEVMSICDDENKKILEMTHTQLDTQFRDVFSKFRQDYNKYFRYSGRV